MTDDLPSTCPVDGSPLDVSMEYDGTEFKTRVKCPKCLWSKTSVVLAEELDDTGGIPD